MPKVLNSISLDAPSSPVSANQTDTFAFTGTPGFSGSGGVQRYDWKWEVDSGGGYVTIASSGTGLTTADTNPLINTNSQSANSITVTCTDSGTYTIRMVGAPTSGGSYTIISATQSVTVAAGAQTLTQDARFDNSNTFYSATVTVGAVTLTPSLYSNTQTFYSPTVAGVGPPQELTPSLYTNTETFYTHTVAAGAVTLLPSLYTNDNTIYSATVTTGPVTLQPALYSNSQTYYTHNIAIGASTLVPELYTNTNVFYSAVVTGAGSLLAPALYSNTNTFYNTTVTPGAINLAPTLLSNNNSFYSPVAAPGAINLVSELLTNSVTFFTPEVAFGVYNQTLQPAFFSNMGIQGDVPYVLKRWDGSQWQVMYKDPFVY